MESVLNNIILLRQGNIPSELLMEKNSYTVSVRESDGSTTCYFFSIPIRYSSGQLVQQTWEKEKNHWNHKCINGNVTVSNDELWMNHTRGKCLFLFPDRYKTGTSKMLVRNYSNTFPTPNGIAIRTRIGQGREYQLILSEFPGNMEVYQNDKSFTLLTKHGMPFITVSGLFSSERNNNSMGSIGIFGQKISKKEYKLIIKPKTPAGHEMCIDIAFCTQTLFQDLTIESRHPRQYNPYGSGAFLGTTIPYGELWMYTELHADLISEYRNRKIKSAIWHIPCHSTPDTNLSFFPISESSIKDNFIWENRPICGPDLIQSKYQNSYMNFDITKELRCEESQCLKGGFKGLLKTQRPGRHLVTISTASSNYAPQILEINFDA